MPISTIQNPKNFKQILLDIGNRLVAKKIIQKWEIIPVINNKKKYSIRILYSVDSFSYKINFVLYKTKSIKEKSEILVKSISFSRSEIYFFSLSKEKLYDTIIEQIEVRRKGIEKENLFENVLKVLKERDLINSYRKSNTLENIAGVDWYIEKNGITVPLNIKSSEKSVINNKYKDILCIAFEDFETKDVKEVSKKIKQFALVKQGSN
jgi:hypothetical protein